LLAIFPRGWEKLNKSTDEGKQQNDQLSFFGGVTAYFKFLLKFLNSEILKIYFFCSEKSLGAMNKFLQIFFI
jgi:hypothetical protein